MHDPSSLLRILTTARRRSSRSSLSAAAARRPRGPPPAPPAVGVVTLAPERVVLTTELPGRTAPYLVAEVRPQVSGLLQRRLFEEGADVRAASCSNQIDPAPYQAAVDQAEARWRWPRRPCRQRARGAAAARLVASRAVASRPRSTPKPPSPRPRRASPSLARRSRAPVSSSPSRDPRPDLGPHRPLERHPRGAGHRLPAGAPRRHPAARPDLRRRPAVLRRLLRLRRVLSSGALARDDQSFRRVQLRLEDGTPYGPEGTLQFQDVTVAPTTGAVTLRMVFPNPEHLLLPGMFVRAVVEEGVDERAILAPQQGVARDPRAMPTRSWSARRPGRNARAPDRPRHRQPLLVVSGSPPATG